MAGSSKSAGLVSWLVVILLTTMTATAEDSGFKHAVPDEATQATSRKLVAEMFREEYKNATTAEARTALAREMVDVAADTKDDPTARYVLLRIGLNVAVQAADVDVALRAVDSLNSEYRVDGPAMKVDVLSKLAKGKRTRAQSEALLSPLGSLYRETLAAEKYDLAERVATLEVSLAKALRDNMRRALAVEHQKGAAKLRRLNDDYKCAVETLKKQPDDPDANLAVGKYRCFVRGDWDRGLAALSLCGDGKLRTVARQELAAEKSNAQKAVIGDEWWSVSKQRDAAEQAVMKHRAAYWYAQAGDDQPTVMKLKIKKRLDEVAEIQLPPEFKKASLIGAGGGHSIEKKLQAFLKAVQDAKLVNLGPRVNCTLDDAGSSISGDGCELVFESGRPGCLGEVDIWISTRTSTRKPFGIPVNLGRYVNSQEYQAAPELSDDGLLLLYQSHREDGLGNWDLWACTRSRRGKPFGMPVNLGASVNGHAAESCPTITSDWLTLMFTSHEMNGTDNPAIHAATRDSKRAPFGNPVKLKPPINTPGCNSHPCLAMQGRMLLFSSTRPGGQGLYDLWVSVRSAPDKPWQTPVNLGPNINTEEYEYSPSLSADGRLLVFSSNRPGGLGGLDLWMVELPLP